MTLAEDLDAAIRAALDDFDDTRWDTKGQVRIGDVLPEPTAALRAILDRCNAVNSMMVASEVRCLIAEALGVPQAGKPGQT